MSSAPPGCASNAILWHVVYLTVQSSWRHVVSSLEMSNKSSCTSASRLKDCTSNTPQLITTQDTGLERKRWINSVMPRWLLAETQHIVHRSWLKLLRIIIKDTSTFFTKSVLYGYLDIGATFRDFFTGQLSEFLSGHCRCALEVRRWSSEVQNYFYRSRYITRQVWCTRLGNVATGILRGSQTRVCLVKEGKL